MSTEKPASEHGARAAVPVYQPLPKVPADQAVSLIKAASVHVEQALLRVEQTRGLLGRTPPVSAETAVTTLWELGWRPPYLNARLTDANDGGSSHE